MEEAKKLISEMSTGNGLKYFKANLESGYSKDDFLNNFQEYLDSRPTKKDGAKHISTYSFKSFLFNKKTGLDLNDILDGTSDVNDIDEDI